MSNAADKKRSCTVAAYAKINLTLDVLCKRPDGYHNIVSIMQTVSLHDDILLSVGTGKAEHFEVRGRSDLPADETNLAVRALRRFCSETGCETGGVEIIITKRIPMGAGLAGGSADAAAVLKGLRKLLLPSMQDESLERIGAMIGSDVPFCLRGGTVLCEGRGELLTTLAAAPWLFTVLYKPDYSFSTPALYAKLDDVTLQSRPNTAKMCRAIADGDSEALCQQVGNVFEQAVGEPYVQEIHAIKQRFLEFGALCAAMSGSGPTVFALFSDSMRAERAYTQLKSEGLQVYLENFV